MTDDCYDRQGNPIDVLDWARRRADEQRVARTKTRHAEISTVWLGLNHNWMPDGPPLIFETMVFGGSFDQHQERYSTEAEALAGHARIVEMVREREEHWEADQ